MLSITAVYAKIIFPTLIAETAYQRHYFACAAWMLAALTWWLLDTQPLVARTPQLLSGKEWQAQMQRICREHCGNTCQDECFEWKTPQILPCGHMQSAEYLELWILVLEQTRCPTCGIRTIEPPMSWTTLCTRLAISGAVLESYSCILLIGLYCWQKLTADGATTTFPNVIDAAHILYMRIGLLYRVWKLSNPDEPPYSVTKDLWHCWPGEFGWEWWVVLACVWPATAPNRSQKMVEVVFAAQV